MTFDLQAAREIIEHMSPLPWIVLEDENGTMNIIRNPNHPMHKDGLDAWGWKEASETPDARGIAFMRAEFPRACDEIRRLDHEVSVARNLASLAKGIVDEQAARIRQLEALLRDSYKCPSCNGTGKRHVTMISSKHGNISYDEPCNLCEGSGHSPMIEQLQAEGKL